MSHVNKTTDYKQFSFLIENRQTARRHITQLKDAIQKNPAILEVQPILVNEKMEIIDGQHRFTAASELGVPISYTMVKGLDIQTARDMNTTQKKWGIEDYAYSYAKAGNVHYKSFLKFHNEYPGISSTILQIVMAGKEANDLNRDFKQGKFVQATPVDEIEWILGELQKIRNLVEVPISKPFVTSLMEVLDNPEFSHEQFMKNLERKPELFHRTSVVRDALRMIEEIYNYGQRNTVRLY